jgi:hypothetical protein
MTFKLSFLQLSRYRYFHCKDTNGDEDKHWQSFKAELTEHIKKIGGYANASASEIKREYAKSGFYVPIISHKTGKSYVEHNGFYRTLDSGIFHDVYAMQGWVGVTSKFVNSAALKKAAESLEDESEFEIGESEFPCDCRCYWSEINNADDIDEKGIKEVLSLLLKSDFYNYIELDFAHFAFTVDFEKQSSAAVILTKNYVDSAKDTAAKLLNKLLYEYFLSVAKVDSETRIISELKTLETRQAVVALLAKYKSHPPKTLSQIENANRELNDIRADLGEKIKDIERHLHTIEINIGNAKEIIRSDILANNTEELSKVLISPLETIFNQKKANLTYHKIIEEKAKVISEEVANLSNLQAGIYGRKLAWVFGLLALVGVLQLFPEFQQKITLWQRIAILIVVVLIPFVVLFRRDIWQGFRQIFNKNEQLSEQAETNLTTNSKQLPSMSAEFEMPQTKEKETVETK